MLMSTYFNYYTISYVHSYDDFMALGSESDKDDVMKICMSLDIDEPCLFEFTSVSYTYSIHTAFFLM